MISIYRKGDPPLGVFKMYKLDFTILIGLLLIIGCSNSSGVDRTIGGWVPPDKIPDVSIISEPDVVEEVIEINEEVSTTSLPDTIEEETSSNPDNPPDVEEIEDVEEVEEVVEDVSEPQPICQDDDGDGWGEGCALGPDCDDYNPYFGANCPDCSKKNHPGCACKGKSAPCYNGDPAFAGKGICSAGVQVCKDGFWAECVGDIGPEAEICNGLDDDCDGEVDEGVQSSCGGCDLSCNEQTIAGKGDYIWDLNSENSSGVGLDQNGGIYIDQTKIALNLKFIWIANSPQNTVSKLDCKSGKEVGRYAVCSNPSRTSVDLNGNVWVGCRGDGGVAKIMAEQKDCTDKNGNGKIDTSSDSNTVGNDECIKFITYPDGATIARAAGVDKDNFVWIGFWNSKRLRRLDPQNGNSVDSVDMGCNPYGLVIDQKGIIWVQGTGCGLVRVDPQTKQINKYPYPAGAYGINVDKFGNIWVASGSNASRFSPITGQWTVVGGIANGGRGVATSNDGFIYTAGDGAGAVTIIDGNQNPPQKIGVLTGAKYPVGVALDYDGFVWAVNQGGSSATKFDPKAKIAVGTYPVGPSPYTYSDMTGYTLNFFTAPKGFYTHTFFGNNVYNPIQQGNSNHLWLSISAEADLPEGTSLLIRFRAANNALELENAAWTEDVSFPDQVFPYNIEKYNLVGKMLQVDVQLITKVKGLSPILKSISAKSKVQ